MRQEQVELAFLTCPASYGEARKEKLCSAAKAAGLFQVELVDEPVAAAMCYCAGGYIQDGQNLLVYDFGGGTFDVSLLEYRNGAFRLLSEPEGLEQCGGADMDHLILEDMLRVVGQEIIEELKKNQMHYLRFTSQLAEMAVRAKHHLSAAEAFEEDIVIGFDMVPYRLTVEQFNKMIAPLVDETVQLCRQAVKNAGISETDISAVLMAGGSSRVPLVREMASRIAPDASLLCAVDLELAVAQGALEYRRFAASKPGAAAKQGQRGELSEKAGTGRRPEGDVEEWFRKGKEAEEREDEEEAVEWYRRAAEAGHAEAMYELGVCYNCGYGVLEDEEKAVEWYDKAAESGHAEAMYELGKCY
ncbi:MAG: Hsp70 family protein, partial [Acetatifactor sp.]|nr:Hsp70 family protein [Acetatifactor sp.]